MAHGLPAFSLKMRWPDSVLPLGSRKGVGPILKIHETTKAAAFALKAQLLLIQIKHRLRLSNSQFSCTGSGHARGIRVF